MRFNNRFCALMDIPDLPQGAFEHIGDKKIKPQGGGGNPISVITDPISSALGTDGGGGGVLGALADVDPGPAIGSGLAEVDKAVNEIPGGWGTVAAVAVPYAAPMITGAALTAAEAAALAAGTSATTGAIQGKPLDQIALNAALAGGTSYGLNSIFGDVGAPLDSEAVSQSITSEAGKEAFFDALSNGASSTDALNAGLSVDALVNGTASYVTQDLMGPTYQELGVTGVDGGFAGPTYGELGYTGLNQAEAIAAADAASKAAAASSISPTQAIQGLKMASGLLSQNAATPAGATAQFRGSTVPQGAVDYSGILNLLQTRAQQRNPYSLLG